jgi:hypothetical protein
MLSRRRLEASGPGPAGRPPCRHRPKGARGGLYSAVRQGDAGPKKEPLMPIKKEDSGSPKRRSGGGVRRKKEMRVPSEIPLLPLRNTVIFPHQIVPLSVGRKKSLKVIEEITKGDKMMIVVAQKDGRVEDPGPEGLYEWGSVVQVVTVFKVPGGAENILVHGVCRAKVERYVQEEPYIKVRITPVSRPSRRISRGCSSGRPSSPRISLRITRRWWPAPRAPAGSPTPCFGISTSRSKRSRRSWSLST